MPELEKTDQNYTNPSKQSILKLFRYKCVRCRREAVVIHEIVPRSLAPNTWRHIKNRVALCNDCHTWAHDKGTKNSASELYKLRKQRLEEYKSLEVDHDLS